MVTFASSGFLSDLGPDVSDLADNPTTGHPCLPYFSRNPGEEDRGFWSAARRTGDMPKRDTMEQFLDKCVGNYLIKVEDWLSLKRDYHAKPGLYEAACDVVVDISPDPNQSNRFYNCTFLFFVT